MSDAKPICIGSVAAGTRIVSLGDGRLICVHPSQPVKLIDVAARAIRELDLSPDELAAIGALKFPTS